MDKQEIIMELKKYRKTMPRQTLKTIRGQSIAGDIEGAKKGLNREIKKLNRGKDEDCFAYADRTCKALKVKNCNGCVFYKTKENAEEGRMKGIERIMSLDEEKRDHIIEIYKLEV